VSGLSGNIGAISGSLFEDYFRIADYREVVWLW
jgi:hypothetical protein